MYTLIIPLCLFCSDGEVKGLCGIYQRIILVPRPDYASRVGTSTLFIISPKSIKGYFRLHCKSANTVLHSSLIPRPLPAFHRFSVLQVTKACLGPGYEANCTQVSAYVTSSIHAVLWKAMISKNGGHYSDALDLSSLAKVTDGYTPGHINTVVTQVLTERRIQQV